MAWQHPRSSSSDPITSSSSNPIPLKPHQHQQELSQAIFDEDGEAYEQSTIAAFREDDWKGISIPTYLSLTLLLKAIAVKKPHRENTPKREGRKKGDGVWQSPDVPIFQHVSSELYSKSLHITLIVGRPFPNEGPELIVLPAHHLNPQVWLHLTNSVAAGAKMVANGYSWVQALGTRAYWRKDLIQRSIQQNHVLFDGTGLTILSIDRIYTLKCRLHSLSNGTISLPSHVTAPCVTLLRDHVVAQKGRPLEYETLSEAYSDLDFSRKVLLDIEKAYKEVYETTGVSSRSTRVKQSTKCPGRLVSFLSLLNCRHSLPDSSSPIEVTARGEQVHPNLPGPYTVHEYETRTV
jgi:hypothetical protein